MRRAAAAAIAAGAMGAAAIVACTSSSRVVQAPMLPVGYVMPVEDAGADGDAATGRKVLAGTYKGVGIQSNGPEWPMLVHFAAGGGAVVHASVRYPSLGCVAEWKLQREGRGGQWTGVENVVSGKRCIAFGVIHVEWVDDVTLKWDWHDTTKKLGARATLTKDVTGRNPFRDREPDFP